MQNLQNLLETIYANNATTIEVKRHTVKHGNEDQHGDYNRLVLVLGETKLVFNNDFDEWSTEE